jgi:predicted permease
MKQVKRVLRLFSRRTRDLRADVSEEFDFHLEMRVAELMRVGLTAEQARAEALRAFGDLSAAEKRCVTEDRMKVERMHRALVLDELKQDLKFGARQLRRDPGFALVAIVTLALGIGMNAVMFTLVDSLFLRPLPYPSAEQLVSPGLRDPRRDGTFYGGNPQSLERVRALTNNVWSLAGWSGWSYTLTGSGEPEVLRGAAVTNNFLDVIGVQPMIGRGFRDGDQVAGQQVAMLSYGLWQRRFAGNRSIIGQTIILNGAVTPVVGVLPPSFTFPAREVEIYRSIEWPEGQPPPYFGTDWFARLEPGVSPERALSALQGAARQIRAEHPELGEDWGTLARVLPLRDGLVGQFRRPAFILMVAVTFVLLIACVNVANLLLTRATVRAKEIAVRASLGAGRLRLLRQLVTESMVIAVLAGALGAVLAWFGVRGLVAWLPADAVNFAEIQVDPRIVGYTMLIAMLTVVLFGLAPALMVSLDRSFDELRASGRSTTPSAGRRRALRGLVAGEIALSVVLGIGGALMLQSFARLRLQSAGFRESNVLTMRVSAPNQRYDSAAKKVQLTRDLLEQVRAIPGVTSAGEIQILPLGGSNWNPGLFVEGRNYTQATAPEVDWRSVTLGYFETMEIPLVTGRTFDARDHADAPKVALINQTLARRVFRNENPIGRRVWTGFERENNWVTIVGVVADTKDQSLAGEANPQIYRPHAQYAINPMQLMLRTSGDPKKVAPAVQRAIWSIDSDIAIADVQPFGRVVGNSVAQPRLLTALLTGFALLAIILGAVGLFGVIAYMVDRRQQEFGIRSALGARPIDLMQLVLGEGTRTVAAGAVAGVIGAVFLTGVLRTQLYEVQPLQPLVFAGIAVLVMLTALLALIAPARRAARANQLDALREG